MIVSFHVPGQPVGKGRPIAGKAFGTGFTTLRTPTKTLNYEGAVAYAAQEAMAGAPLIEGAARVQMSINVMVPASWSRKKRTAAEAGDVFPTTKPDCDNVVKAIFDAINGVVWKDDVQVVELHLTKRYSLVPGVAVRIETAEAA